MFVIIPLIFLAGVGMALLVLFLLLLTAILVLASAFLGTHTVFRWPIAFCVGVLLMLELLAYLVVRWFVTLLEWAFMIRRGDYLLHSKMEAAMDYKEWRECALKLDEEGEYDTWKHLPDNEHYHRLMVQTAVERLRAAKQEGDIDQLIIALSACLVKNFGGIMNYPLYIRTHCGTKFLIEEYVEEVTSSLKYLCSLKSRSGSSTPSQTQAVNSSASDCLLGKDYKSSGADDICPLEGGMSAKGDQQNKRNAELEKVADFLRKAKLTYGNTCLLMSGGAMMGMYHWGVMKTLVEEGLMPKIICGTSAGSVISGYMACRTDKEIIDEMDGLVDLHVSNGPLFGSTWWKIRQLWNKGYLYEKEDWSSRLTYFTKDMTFKEAFNKTGRLVNITCTPTKCHVRGHPPLILNHITSPNVTIASAIMASSCVPLLSQPATLIEKCLYTEELRPFPNCKSPLGNYGGLVQDQQLLTLRDGTFECDVPVQAMSEMFNCHFNIVSQVNPHIIPFFFNAQGGIGQPTRWRERFGGWRGGFLLSALELWLKEDMQKNLKVLASLNLLVDVFGVDWGYIWLQQRLGDVTVVPDPKYADYFRIASNLRTNEEFWEKVHIGERSAWQNFSFISNRVLIQKALQEALDVYNIPS